MASDFFSSIQIWMQLSTCTFSAHYQIVTRVLANKSFQSVLILPRSQHINLNFEFDIIFKINFVWSKNSERSWSFYQTENQFRLVSFFTAQSLCWTLISIFYFALFKSEYNEAPVLFQHTSFDILDYFQDSNFTFPNKNTPMKWYSSMKKIERFGYILSWKIDFESQKSISFHGLI